MSAAVCGGCLRIARGGCRPRRQRVAADVPGPRTSGPGSGPVNLTEIPDYRAAADNNHAALTVSDHRRPCVRVRFLISVRVRLRGSVGVLDPAGTARRCCARRGLRPACCAHCVAVVDQPCSDEACDEQQRGHDRTRGQDQRTVMHRRSVGVDGRERVRMPCHVSMPCQALSRCTVPPCCAVLCCSVTRRAVSCRLVPSRPVSYRL